MDVKTAGRTVGLFEVFAKAREPLSLSEIGRSLDAPLSSCLYLVRALESRGYLYQLGSKRHIYPTRKLLAVANAITKGESWAARLEPIMTELRDTTKETVILGKRQGTRVVYLLVLEGPQTIRYSANIGDYKPLHSSAVGKALLSALPAAELTKLMAKLPLDPVTPATITDRAALMSDLKKSTAQGYAVSRAENVNDVFAISKALSLGEDQFAISIAGPNYRMAPLLEAHGKLLVEALAEFSPEN